MSERRFALLIANDEYDDPRLSRLKAPPHDATDLERVLQDPAIGGFAGVKTLINQQAQTIRDEIARFFTGKERDDLLMVYFSGHGVLDKDDRSLYLAVKDTQTDLLSSRGIEAHAVTRQMDKSQVRRIVLIFDCCYSGAFERTKGLSVGTTLDIGQSFEGSGFGRVVLTASNAVQVAFDGDQVTGDFEQSLFTHYLVEGLETGAAGGTSEWITVDALYAYVHRQVTRTGRQTPHKWAYKQEGRSSSPATRTRPPRSNRPPWCWGGTLSAIRRWTVKRPRSGCTTHSRKVHLRCRPGSTGATCSSRVRRGTRRWRRRCAAARACSWW